MTEVDEARLPDRRVRLATAITVVLALGALTCLGIAATGGADAPLPALSATQPSAPHTADPVAPTEDAPPAPLPVSIRIASIGVSSQVQSVGQNADGSLQVPAPGPRYDQPGWYRYSPAPGSIGPSVIVGHLDSAANGPSVFFRLGSLRKGDTVVIKRADGSTVTFVVNSVLRFHKKSFPTQLVYGDTGDVALRLITCGGAISAKTGHYLDNIVVLASMLSIVPGPSPARSPRAL